MLQLLTIDQAACFLLYWSKKIADPSDPKVMVKIIEDEGLCSIFYLHRAFISNAVDAGELPALKKPKSKPEEKRLMGNANIPEKIKDKIEKLHDVWISWEDLTVFAERPPSISTHSYPHSRQSLAIIAWILIKELGYDDTNPTKLHEEISMIVDDYELKNIPLQLRETTLKTSIKEIFDTKEEILKE